MDITRFPNDVTYVVPVHGARTQLNFLQRRKRGWESIGGGLKGNFISSQYDIWNVDANEGN